ncbi:HAMP domain-containing sensor histidine kinase [Myxococcaceae bacterium GXIMD 01537]
MSQVEGLAEGREELALADEQRVLAVLGVALVTFWPVDVLSMGAPPWDTLALRLLWSALMLFGAWALGRVGRRWREGVRFTTGTVVPNVMFGVICWRLGGADNPVFAWMCALPLTTLSVMHGRRRVALASLACTLVVGLVVTVAGGLPPARVALWLLLFVASGVVAFQSARFFRRLYEAQARAEARERAAQEALAASQASAFQAERLAQVGRLAAGVAHEVNNPLAYIQANLRYLREECGAPGADAREQAEALQETMAGVERIRQIVQDLTAYARTTEGPQVVGPCALPRVIEESVRLASVRLRRLSLALEVPTQVPEVRADARRLGQVLLNLLLNAADALEEASVTAPRVALRVVAAGERVRVELEDNGPGIAPENLPRLFTPFFTTKAPGKGTGLGLALSRQYVEGFGGQLSADNRPGGGARFTVELPVA